MKQLIVILVLCAFGGSDCDIERSMYQETAMKDFNYFCPYTDMCSKPAPEQDIGGGFFSCCNSCQCSVDCGSNCCPDKPSGFLGLEDLRNVTKSQCISPGYPFERKEKDTLYEIIYKCPHDYNNSFVKTKCHNFIDAFNFDGPMDGFLPVTSNSDPLPYKNIYCAECNDAPLYDLTTWVTNVSCTEEQPIRINTFKDIPGICDSLIIKSRLSIIANVRYT